MKHTDDLVMIVPSRGRPHAVAPLAESFGLNCTANTTLLLVVDDDDPDLEDYRSEVENAAEHIYSGTALMVLPAPGNMANALNAAGERVLADPERPFALGFMGDDHRPRTFGWDAAYLNTLRETPGMVYGDDLLQGVIMPTQFALNTEIVEEVGFLSPPGLIHLCIDIYWRDVMNPAKALTYREDVVVEHMHPANSKAEEDEGYLRVNNHEVQTKDVDVYYAHLKEHCDRDVAAILRGIERVKAAQ